MTGSILSYLVGTAIDRMQFPHQAGGGRAVSDRVLTAFKSGAMLGLRGAGMDVCRRESFSLPWNVRAFFNEGHAMGCAGRQACSLRRRNPELTASADYEIMRFVGYGFWNGIAALYPLPRVPDSGAYWKGAGAFPKYRLLMANGRGFSLMLFRNGRPGLIRDIASSERDNEKRDAVLHGIGRALWFLYLYNYTALNRILEGDRDLAEPLAIGLGLAMAFTQASTPEGIVRSLQQFPENYRLDLIRGAGIGLQVHAQNDPECRAKLEELVRGELREWYEGAWGATREAGEADGWYPRYHQLTRRFSDVAVAKDLRHA